MTQRSARRIFIFLFAGFATSIYAGTEYQAKPGEEVVPNELIVRLKPGGLPGNVIPLFLPTAQVTALALTNLYQIQVPAGIAPGITTALAAHALVDFVAPNRVMRTNLATPIDPNYSSQWGLSAVQALQAWGVMPSQYLTSSTASATRIKVAVIDTGADCSHPDFVNSGGSSSDVASGGQLNWAASQAVIATTVAHPAGCPWMDDNGHGTHTAGIVVAATSNGTGVSALGYPLQVLVFKVLNQAGNGTSANVANAIKAAADAGVQVISMSLGGAGYDPASQLAINYAWQRNVVVVSAAGNSNSSSLFYPGDANLGLGISATDSGNTRASFSNFGTGVALGAPGLSILSTLPTYSVTLGCCNYGYLSGTSMATPFVAALAGLVATATPGISNTAIVQQMEQTASASNTANGGWNQNVGWGVINAYNAISNSPRPASVGGVIGQVMDTFTALTGNPINGAQITINGQTITTDNQGDGLFRFSNLPAGTYAVSASASGFTSKSLSVTVAPGADTPMIIAMGSSYGHFGGTVTDAGVAVPGAVVQALSAGLIVGVAVADAGGNYSLWVPGGATTYNLRTSATGRSAFLSAGMTVAVGGTTTANLTLPRMGTITGTVRDASSHLVDGAQVAVSSAAFTATATTAFDGTYTLIGLPNGSYSVTATLTNQTPVSQNAVSVTADTSAVVNLQFTNSEAPVAAPVINPPGGAFTTGQAATITTSTAGASIRYTTDGSTPTDTNGILYNGAIPIPASSTLKALAFEPGMADSGVVSAGFTINLGAPAWFNNSWSSRKAVTIPSTSGSSTLANFPVLISLGSDANLMSNAQASGNDILFTAADGTTKLNHEIELYNSASGQLLAWVQVPVLSPGTVIYMYYGNAAAGPQQNQHGVWDSSFSMVQHLPNGAALSATDATSNLCNASNLNSTSATAGEIDGGASFNGTSNSIDFPSCASLNNWTAQTISVWAKAQTDMVSLARLVEKGNNNEWTLLWNFNAGSQQLTIQALGNTGNLLTSATPIADNTWHKVDVTIASNNLVSLYVDGALNGSAVSPTSPSSLSGTIRLGQYGGGGLFYHGLADELRISNFARPAAWIGTEFSNQSAPATFFSLGAQQTNSGGGTVATPTFNPPAGTYSSAQPVAISSTTAGASIYYTTNGTAPSTSSTLYTGPVSVASSLTLNAIGHLSGMTDSAVGSAAYTITGGAGWYNVGGTWAHRKTVTIDHTKVSAALTNFPVLVSLASDANLSAGALANGNDLLFTASDGITKLDHEIETYTSASGQLIAWVRVPALSSSADTVLYLYYGNAASANQQHAPGVWDANFAAVQHLANGATLSGADSTSNANNGNLSNSPLATTGKIDGAADLSPANSKIDVNASGLPTATSAPFTIQSWQKSASYVSLSVLFGFGTQLPSVSGPNRYLLEYNNHYYFWGGNADWDTGIPFDADNAWHQWAFSFDGSTLTFYRDGIARASQPGLPAGSAPAASFLTLGSHHSSGSNPAAALDEARISTTARSAPWIATEFANQNSPATFFSLGVQQNVGGGGGGTVATPTFNPPAGTYSSAQPVTISSTTGGASIYYTTDGSQPTTGSTLYSGPVSVASSLTLNAIGHFSGMTDSAVGSAAYTITGGAGWYNVGGTWAHRKTVTIDHTKVSAALTNFPVLVSLASDANLSAGALSNGNDLLFTASDGITKLDHEIETYTSASGQLIAWVRVPALSSSADTVLYLYYGNAASANQQHAPGVWDANFAAVQHLANGATLSGADSTSNANNGNLSNSPLATTGKIDGAADLSPANSKIDVNASGLPTATSAPFTIQSWQKSASYVSLSVLFGFGTQLPSVSGPNRYLLEYNNHYYFWGGNADWDTGIPFDADNAWHQWAFSFDGSTLTFYRDGIARASQPGLPAGSAPAASFLTLGSHHSSGSNPAAALDEARISTTARSAPWIATEFANQNSPATFFSLGVQQNVGGGGGGTVATPTFNPPAGTYSSAQPVTISSTTGGASIYYTTDGSQPTTGSTLYTGPVSVASSLTLNAIGHLSGMTDSAVGSAAYTITGGAGWYNVGGTWAHRKTVTIDHTKVSAALTNFPVLVSLASDANLSAGALANGNDLLFTASDGITKLDHEIETYTSASGQLIAWVRVPALSSSADTVLYLYYGNAASANQQHAPGVWDANFAAVQHLANGATLSGADSTSNANNGNLSNSPLATTGKIDGAADLSPANSKIDVNASGLPTATSAPFTIQSWQKSASYVSLSVLFGFGTQLPSVSGPNRYLLEYNNHYYFWGGNADWDTGIPFDADNAWHQWAFSFDGSTLTFYRDGIARASQPGLPAGSAPAASFLTLGSHHSSGSNPAAALDEARISTTARSAPWIATEFANQNSPATFFSLGVQQ